MSIELSTVVDETLFKPTTDSLTGTKTLKSISGDLVWQDDPAVSAKAYSYLYAPSTSLITLTGGSLTSDDSYVDLNAPSMWAAGSNLNVIQNDVDGSLTTSVAGVYRLTLWCDVTSSTANTNFSFRYEVNGVQSTSKLQVSAKEASAVMNVSATGLFSLSSGVELKIKIAADTSCTASIVGGGFIIEKIDDI
jgi:hypothetical protein